MHITIVYWSGSGNTQTMAEAVERGAKSAGAEVTLLEAGDATEEILASDALLFGCPAMGAEELEESVFEPLFTSLESRLNGKRVGLFGSYGWGDGEWMRTWQDRVAADGALLIADGVIANEAPDDDALAACEELGKKAAQ